MTISEWKKKNPGQPKKSSELYPHPIPKERVDAFKKLLKSRLGYGYMTKLCDMAGVGRTHFADILKGTRGGKFTWKRIDLFLSQEEKHVLRGTMSEKEQTNTDGGVYGGQDSE